MSYQTRNSSLKLLVHEDIAFADIRRTLLSSNYIVDVLNAKNLSNLIHAMLMTPVVENEILVGVTFKDHEKHCFQSDLIFFMLLAKYADGFIELVNTDGHIWRWLLHAGQLDELVVDQITWKSKYQSLTGSETDHRSVLKEEKPNQMEHIDIRDPHNPKSLFLDLGDPCKPTFLDPIDT